MLNDENELEANAQGEIEGIDANLFRGVLEAALSLDATNATLCALTNVFGALNSEYVQYFLRAIGAVYESDLLTQRALWFVLWSGDVRDQDKLRGMYSGGI